jgi:hypothetical protein
VVVPGLKHHAVKTWSGGIVLCIHQSSMSREISGQFHALATLLTRKQQLDCRLDCLWNWPGCGGKLRTMPFVILVA